MNITNWFDVGKLSAERDEHLNDYFFDNGILNYIINNKSAFLVLGRKGAGKTALFYYLSNNPSEFIPKTNILTALSMDDYSWNVHFLLEQKIAAESQAYKLSWKFVLLVEAIRAYMIKASKPKEEIVKLSKILERIFGSPIPNMFELMKSKILRISKVSLPKGGIDLENGGVDSLEVSGGEIAFEDIVTNTDLKQQLTNNIEGLLKYIELVLALNTLDVPVYICIDRVDEAWDATSVEVSKKVITGLISAADAITQKYKGIIRPIVFVREDIFDTLPLNDKNKLREDCGSLLKWERDSLIRMLLKRINYYARRSGIEEISDIDSLFDRQEIRQRSKPFNYILKRTMMRPRDLISFFTKIIDVMKDNSNDPFGENIKEFEKLESESIYQAESEYSEWLKSEIKEEWEVQFPSINSLLSSIQNIGSTNIAKELIELELAKLGESVEESKLLESLKFLYLNSIIGFKIGSSTAWKFKCFYNSQGFIESEEYHIHDGLIRSLNLKEPREVQE